MTLEGRLVPVSRMRAAIARRMTESKQQAPHFYVSTEVEMDAVTALLTELNGAVPAAKVTATAALVRACAIALARHPRVNSVWTADGVMEVDEINVGVAVALDDGLIAPALLGAGRLDLTGTAVALTGLVERARTAKLKPAELSEGTFTLSNLGMFEVSSFSAIVTPPQVAILATGCSIRRLLPAEEGARVASVMTATLSVDHRILDGADGAAFLETLKGTLEAPESLLQKPEQPEEEKA